MELWNINDEQRMTLRLTDIATAVWEDDKINFTPKSPSDYFCRIFEHYYEISQASIGQTLTHQTEQLNAVLREHATPSVVAALRKYKEQELIQYRDELGRGEEPVAIRLQNQTKYILERCKMKEGAYYRSPRLYMQAVIEDYFRQSGAQRERIYYADRFEIIESAIATKRQLRVTVSSGKIYLMHPCQLQMDKLANGWYLAGYSHAENKPIETMRLATFRVSNIKEISAQKAKITITAPMRQELENKIRTQGIQFLTENPSLISVRMTAEGAKSYANMATMRPPCRRKDGDIWEFDCGELQAFRYFTRMAQNCEVLSPQTLRSKMIKFLNSGQKNYEKNQ